MNFIENRLSELICNRKCIDFRFVEGGTLIIYFAASGTTDTQTHDRIWIDSAWRLQIGQNIAVGSLDDGDIAVKALKRLVGQSLSSLTANAISHDLRLSFTNEMVVETFGYSILSESWEFRGTGGYRFGVGPDFLTFERMEEPDSSDANEKS